MANYQESTGGTLPYWNTQIENLLNKGQTLAGQQATTAGMPAQTVAGFTPMQQQAFGLAQSNVGNYQPMLNQASQFANKAVEGSQFDPSQLAQYMNPYTQSVVQEIGRLGNEQFQNQILPGLSSNFSGLGQYGSARQAALMADAAARNQREVLGQQSQALNTSYQNAMNAYQNWAQMGIGANQSAATQMGNLAQVQQNLGLADVGALTAGGALQQQQAQKQADLPFLNWQQQQAYPWQSLNNWANLFKAGTPQSTTSWNTSFKKGGLARFADGGRFSDDEDGLTILDRMAAAGENPDDYDTAAPWFREALDASPVVVNRPVERIAIADRARVAPVRALAESPANSTLSDAGALMRSAFDERLKMLERLRGMKQFEPREAPSVIAQMGEAMMRSAAQGPADLGQLIGRAGASYFDRQEALDTENKNRALQRLALEEKIAPEITSAAARGALGDNYKVVTGQDGIPRLVNARDPTQQVKIGEGVNEQKLDEESKSFAKTITDAGLYKSDREKAEAFTAYQDAYKRNRRAGMSPIDATKAAQASTSAVELPVSSTPILTPSEKQQQEGIGKAQGDIAGGYLKAKDTAENQLNTIKNLRANLEGYQSGRITPYTSELARWGEAFGLKFAENVSGREVVNALRNQLTLEAGRTAEGTSALGQMTDTDREFVLKSLPGLENTPEGNEKLLAIMEKIAKRKIDRANMAKEYIENNPRGVLDSGFDKKWMEYQNQHPMFANETKRLQPQVGEIRKGYKFIGGNPSDPKNWEKQ